MIGVDNCAVLLYRGYV